MEGIDEGLLADHVPDLSHRRQCTCLEDFPGLARDHWPALHFNDLVVDRLCRRWPTGDLGHQSIRVTGKGLFAERCLLRLVANQLKRISR